MTVYLVGAGPGDPGLITVRGAEVLARAEVVVYDRLSVASLLDLAPPGAQRINVGKAPRGPSVPQEEINALLVEHGRRGKEVVRLKGGDPFVFARGGEEAQALEAAGISYEVVPGITSAIAAPAYAGIPLTLRHSSTSFTVVTGHEDPTKGDPAVDWEAIARVGGTIVILMGVGRFAKISAALMRGGLDPATPAAAVRWGTRPEQTTIRSTLGELAEQPLASPSTIVVGEVAATHLTWFDSKPLLGLRVAVTRTRQQASGLVAALAGLGAETVEVPVIRIVEADDGGAALGEAAKRVSEYDWVVFSSANAVERFMAVVRDARALGGVSVGAVGPATAAALSARGVIADLVPSRAVGEALVAEMPPAPPSGGRVLLPRAAVARDVVPEGLAQLGWQVDVVEAYRTVTAEPSSTALAALASADVVTFTSSSTVERLLEALAGEQLAATVACIGPVTAATARQLGLEVTVEASEHTVDGLVDAIVSWATNRT